MSSSRVLYDPYLSAKPISWHQPCARRFASSLCTSVYRSFRVALSTGALWWMARRYCRSWRLLLLSVMFWTYASRDHYSSGFDGVYRQCQIVCVSRSVCTTIMCFCRYCGLSKKMFTVVWNGRHGETFIIPRAASVVWREKDWNWGCINRSSDFSCQVLWQLLLRCAEEQ